MSYNSAQDDTIWEEMLDSLEREILRLFRNLKQNIIDEYGERIMNQQKNKHFSYRRILTERNRQISKYLKPAQKRLFEDATNEIKYLATIFEQYKHCSANDFVLV